ncbi:protein transport protein Sec61 subunit beta-like [Montipora foliosa]|uniref:protein transport protein Sec61 subunit beta-like n=1 Tax=Montipora foliosa TaxID=591990 RepID=UPI0035F1ECE2
MCQDYRDWGEYSTSAARVYGKLLTSEFLHLNHKRRVITMVQAASSTSVGSGRSGSKSVTPRSSGGTQVKQRKGGSSAPATRSRTAASSSGMWRFYTEDSPGLKVGPVPVLVMSLLFIASVFMLHIWGKYTRG